ncbi:transposase [Nitrospirillum sp. BR 11752]|uniref:transposase n=1 Tax=Nitrospirillum sp. BR 11752 TaxID=3104293 RepID=UPI003FA5A521
MDTMGGKRRRRTWSEALKREIVAASFEPGASASVVARRYDVNTNQLFVSVSAAPPSQGVIDGHACRSA